ncbi:tumor necrosis factor receptor superfamily member 14 [Spea bombifrons]|uniref:tumor necrosis factor receptor superfamily member 14 n=1 Tax=Spea bombifrons TaxID=233779 RepID=UPI00234B198A|nr:tumor necrosis factor receptor superfamily member 14 [Spea bombifrons]
MIRLFTMSFCAVLFLDIISACVPGEYFNNNQCCPKCNPGSVVKTHCSDITSTVCIPCTDETYMDHPNGVTKCLRCKACDSGAGLITKKACTYTSNTECDCETGSFCDVHCDICQKHKICSPGERVKINGTKRTDTVCEQCPEGTFRNETMSDCIPWTKCSSGSVEKAGTNTSDIVCGSAMRARWWYHYLGVPAVLIYIICICTYWCRQQRNTEGFSVQETGIQQHPEAEPQLTNC